MKKGNTIKRIVTVSLVLLLVVSAVMATLSFSFADDDIEIRGNLKNTVFQMYIKTYYVYYTL